ncbi:MAG: glycosyltransferase family 39 protein [Candidatus Aureabacteria bacterium]|nr:glycosyltransferase family 39 protein [Candidatus Auribacterota bacterium]
MERSRILVPLLAAILLCSIACQCVTSLLRESNIFDEIAVIEFGSSFWHDRQVPFPPHHYPLLLPVLYTFPMKFLSGVRYPPYPSDRVDDLGHTFMWKVNRGKAGIILTICRLPVVLVSVLLGFFVFRFARESYGNAGGLLSLFLYSLSPSIIAHSRYVHLDLGGACFGLISVYYFWRCMESPSGRSAILAGVTLGLALLSKHSNLILLPTYIGVSVVKMIFPLRAKEMTRPPLRNTSIPLIRLLVICILAVSVISLFCSFIKNSNEGSAKLLERLGPPSRAVRVVNAVADVLFLRPYWDGLRELQRHARGGHSAFLMGKYSFRGWWYYYFICFLIKTPVPFLVLLATAVCGYRGFGRADPLRDALLIVPVAIIFILSTRSGQDIGERHILFVYPLLFVFLGRVANAVPGRVFSRKIFRYAVPALCLWYLTEAIMIYPHYLAYFNEFIGGPKNGYKYLVDSNLDWGQDLKGLKRYMDAHGTKKIKLAYFGTADPSYYGIDYEYLPCSGLPRPSDFRWNLPAKGLMAISATDLQSVYFVNKNVYAWLRKYKPIDTIGYSIFIYTIQ